MRRRPVHWPHLFFLAAFFVSLIPAAVPARAGEPLRMAFLPRFSSAVVHAKTVALAQYLEAHGVFSVEPVVAKDFKHYLTMIRHGEIDIGLQNPVVYVQVSDVHQVQATVIKNGSARLRGAVIVRQDSPIRGLEDLRGKTIAYVGPGSASGYLSQKLTLAEAGIDVDRDCKLISAVDNKHENVILSVFNGDVDAGFIRLFALKRVKKYVPIGQIRVVGEGAWLPNWALSTRRDLDPDVQAVIRHAVLNIPEGDPVLAKMGINGFAPATDADYDGLRQALGLALAGEKTGPAPRGREPGAPR